VTPVASTADLPAALRDDGFVVLRGVVPRATVDGVLARVEHAVEDHVRYLLGDGVIRDPCPDLPVERRLAAVYAQTDSVRPRKWYRCLFSEALHALVTAPRLLEALQALLGPDVVFNGDEQLVTKLPGCPRTAFPWHQDSQYYGRDAAEARVLTVWVPLVEAGLRNGCLEVIPGSHRWGLLPWSRDEHLNVRIPFDVTSRADPVALPMAPGDAVVLTHRTLHASGLNRSATVRWSVDLGYSAPGGVTSPAQRDAERALHRALLGNGRAPLWVVRDGVPAPESWADWQARRDGHGAPVWEA
jgi:hypothetical protein